jgi:outer membrane protein OmpA-like peptidoglycan-associated protein
MKFPTMKSTASATLSAALLLAGSTIAQAEDNDKPRTFTTRSIIQQLKPKEEQPSLGGFRGVVIVPPKAQQEVKKEAGEDQKKIMQNAVQGGPTPADTPAKATDPEKMAKPAPVVKTPPPSINMSVQFEFGSAKLTTEAVSVLSNLGEALSSTELADYKFLLAGHTDAVGSSTYNKKLSMLRAASVRDHLINSFGIDGGRLSSVGLGEEKLLDPSQPESGINRRVQITNLGR